MDAGCRVCVGTGRGILVYFPYPYANVVDNGLYRHVYERCEFMYRLKVNDEVLVLVICQCHVAVATFRDILRRYARGGRRNGRYDHFGRERGTHARDRALHFCRQSFCPNRSSNVGVVTRAFLLLRVLVDGRLLMARWVDERFLLAGR